jgi:hypothetical protein
MHAHPPGVYVTNACSDRAKQPTLLPATTQVRAKDCTQAPIACSSYESSVDSKVICLSNSDSGDQVCVAEQAPYRLLTLLLCFAVLESQDQDKMPCKGDKCDCGASCDCAAGTCWSKRRGQPFGIAACAETRLRSG